MPVFTPFGREAIHNLSIKYGVSENAIETMIQAVQLGHGTMAQFNHPELGGFGQWMQGGMTMVGDMFNSNLKFKVEGLGNDIAAMLADPNRPVFAANAAPASSDTHSSPSFNSFNGQWWGGDFGLTSATGSQNGIRYAYFANTHRLAIEKDGKVTIYDTKDHQISGVSQQQGSNNSLMFTSQYGLVSLDSLPILSGGG